MLSNTLDRISYVALLLTIVLMPVFFLPFTRIPVDVSKGLLLVAGLVVSIIFWILARFSDGKIVFPRSKLLLAGLGIVVSFFLSSLFSSVKGTSFFGVMFDNGTFWFILAAYLLLLASSVILSDGRKARTVFFSLIISSVVLLVFQTIHLLFPAATSFGILANKTQNILGSWNALGIFAGFAAIISLFMAEFFVVSHRAKILLTVSLVLSILFIAAVNYPLVWILLGIFALIIFVYKISFSAIKKQEGEHIHFPLVSFILVMICLFFFMSSGRSLGGFIPRTLGISSIEVGPSLGATTTVAKGALAENPIFGVGPNRFGEAWAMYKPAVVNNTPFWDTFFDSGSGLIPTFLVTTGIVGIVAWIIFIGMFMVSGVRSLFASVRSGINWEMTAFFVGALYFFVAAFFYPVGSAVFLLSFAFIGIFIGLSSGAKENGMRTIVFTESHSKNFVAVLVLVLLMIATAAGSFKYTERLISLPYYSRALTSTDLPSAEASIIRALRLNPNDMYLRTSAQVYLIKLAGLVSKNSLTEAERASLQTVLDQSISSGVLAVNYNPGNYQNYQTLGGVYQAVASFGVAGAYDKAIEAYDKAAELNPLNPGIKLAKSRALFAQRKNTEAKTVANLALELKPDYVDALLTLSQIARSSGSTSEAITYAEKALAIAPTNKDIISYVNTLKGGSSSTTGGNTE